MFKQKFLFILLFVFSFAKAQNTPSFSVTVLDTASKGYYFLVPIKIGAGSGTFQPKHMILDKSGNVVYYKPFIGTTGDFKIQPNNNISYSRQNKFYLMDGTFTVVDSVTTKNGVLFDGHDLQVLPNGHFLLLGFENVTMNLSSYNYFNNNNSPGSATATVKCGVIQEQDANKNVVFEWHCKDYFSFSDVDPIWLSNPNNVDWTHMNAVECDADGNFLVSSRHFNEITKVKRSDGSIMWRLGGNQNQFNFTNDANKFIGQHDIRRLPNGNITLWDNGRNGVPVHAATAKEYQLDENLLTATLAWSYTENSNTYSSSLGDVQRLANGNTLINYGTLNNLYHVFNVVKPSGAKIFEIKFTDSLRSYRSFNYPVLPWDLNRPAINCNVNNGQVILDSGSGYGSYSWSNGATTQTIVAINSGTYSVFVPKGQGGFISAPIYSLDISNPCINTALEEKNESAGFKVYPVPAQDQLFVSNSGSVVLKMELQDVLGHTVYTREIIANEKIVISLHSVAPGLYFLKAGEKTIKIIKN